MGKKPYQIVYEFIFEDGSVNTFNLQIDPQTISISLPESEPKPEWTYLEYRQCTCCPLDPSEVPICPIAINIADLVEKFKNEISSDQCTVRCHTPERTYSKETSIQEGLFSIFGIIMPTSNCPVMSFLKPMARFHLPFSTVEETVFRSTSVYLLRQFFEYKQGRKPDLEFKNLNAQYQVVQQVNKGIINRTRAVAQKDADKNAMIILNALAQMLAVEIEDGLYSLEYLFQS